MFDTNTWQKVVVPERFPREPNLQSMETIHRALRDGRIQGFISETVGTLESVPRGERSAYFARLDQNVIEVAHEAVTVDPATGRSRIRMTVSIGDNAAAHPGLHGVLTDRLRLALDLGMRLVPGTRLGTRRPGLFAEEQHRIPLTPTQRENVWPLVERVAEVASAIEARGVGFAQIAAISERLRRRHGLPEHPWYSGLQRAVDAGEQRAIDNAVAEWADGDTVAVHVAYGFDLICTEDTATGAGRSIFDPENRRWLGEEYGVTFASLRELAHRIGMPG